MGIFLSAAFCVMKKSSRINLLQQNTKPTLSLHLSLWIVILVVCIMFSPLKSLYWAFTKSTTVIGMTGGVKELEAELNDDQDLSSCP